MSPKTPKKGDVAADAAVYDAIRPAMHLGRLAPGMKLQEPALARVLGVSRERVRKALHRLVHEGWLTAVPNRGTFVPSLTVEEMREIYDVRSMLEAAIVRRLSAEHSTAAAKRLKSHVAEEKAATRRNDRGRLFALSGDFHILLAELCGNEELTKLVRALLTRSTMHFSLAAPERFHNVCRPHTSTATSSSEGESSQRKAERAKDKLMLAHLVGLVALQLWRSCRPLFTDHARERSSATDPTLDWTAQHPALLMNIESRRMRARSNEDDYRINARATTRRGIPSAIQEAIHHASSWPSSAASRPKIVSADSTIGHFQMRIVRTPGLRARRCVPRPASGARARDRGRSPAPLS